MPAGLLTPRRLLFPASNVPAASGRTVVSFPVGQTGHEYKHWMIHLTDGGVDATDAQIDAGLDEIQVNLGGKPILSFSGAEWMDIMGYDRALTANKGIVPVRFDQIDSRTADGEDEPGLGTLDVSSLELVLKWNAASAIDGIETIGKISGQNKPLGLYHVWRKFNPTLNGAQEHIFDGVELVPGRALSALHVKNANITDVEVELGDLRIYEGSKAVLDHDARENEKVPNAAWCHIDYTVMHRHGHALRAIGKPRHKLTFGVDPAGAVSMFAKTIETYNP